MAVTLPARDIVLPLEVAMHAPRRVQCCCRFPGVTSAKRSDGALISKLLHSSMADAVSPVTHPYVHHRLLLKFGGDFTNGGRTVWDTALPSTFVRQKWLSKGSTREIRTLKCQSRNCASRTLVSTPLKFAGSEIWSLLPLVNPAAIITMHSVRSVLPRSCPRNDT